MNKRNGNTLTSHFIFRRLKEFCSYSFMLFRRFHIKSVKKGFRGIFCFGISNTSYHSVILIDCNPKHISTVKVVFAYIQQIFVYSGFSSESIFGLQNHKNKVIPVFLFIKLRAIPHKKVKRSQIMI